MEMVIFQVPKGQVRSGQASKGVGLPPFGGLIGVGHEGRPERNLEKSFGELRRRRQLPPGWNRLSLVVNRVHYCDKDSVKTL